MTPVSKRLEDVRLALLSALNDPRTSVRLLRELLAQAHSQTPELFVPHQVDTIFPGIESNQHKWGADYLSRHTTIAPFNFSRERLEHIIEVFDYCQKNGHKDFAAPAGTPQISDIRTAQKVPMNSSFTPSSNLEKFVAEGDLLTIRTALRLELNDNRLSGQILKAALTWTQAKTPNLCEPLAEKAFARGINPDPGQWDVDYYGDQVVYLKTNFAKERFEHLIEVREHLRERRVDGFEPISTAAAQEPPRASAPPSSPQPASTHTHRAQPAPPSQELSPAFKKALLIGGALAAFVILLVTLVK